MMNGKMNWKENMPSGVAEGTNFEHIGSSKVNIVRKSMSVSLYQNFNEVHMPSFEWEWRH